MDYYDGNTVTGAVELRAALRDERQLVSTNFGPSTPGAVNVTAGNTFGAICGPSSAVFGAAAVHGRPRKRGGDAGEPAAQGSGTLYSDADPNFDICSKTQDGRTAASTIQMGGRNVGDLLDSAHVSWGWFQGGFASPDYVPGQPGTDDLSTVCTGAHDNIGGASQLDYNPHHEPFQYYASTANPHAPAADLDRDDRPVRTRPTTSTT